MNKAFYISGIVLSIVFIFLGAYYAEEVRSAKWDSIWNSMSSYDYGYGYDYTYDSGSRADDLTFEASLWSLLFFLFFIASDLLGLLKVKTKTSKVISIIGLSFSGIFLIWNFAVMASGGGISYDEVFGGYVLYCLIVLAFSIIGLVQSVRFANTGNAKPAVVNTKSEKDLLDS